MTMLAIRKLVSVMIVLMMVTSGVALTAFAGETPIAEKLDVPISDEDDGVFVIPEPKSDEGEVEDYQDVINVDAKDLLSGYVVDDFDGVLREYGRDMDVMTRSEHVPTMTHKPVKKPMDTTQAADILLVDRDGSDNTGTSDTYNNSGPWETDFTHTLASTLTSLGIQYDLHLNEYGDWGPDFETMVQYKVIIWNLGFDYSATMYRTDFVRLQHFMDAGGSVWIIGHAWLWSITDLGNFTIDDDNAFQEGDNIYDYFGIEEQLVWTGLPDPVNATTNIGLDGRTMDSRRYITHYNEQQWPSGALCSITRPRSSAMTILQGDSTGLWDDSFNDEPVAVAYDASVDGKSHKIVTQTYDVCYITNDADREHYVSAVIAWLGKPTLTLPTKSIMNWYIDAEDHASGATAVFDNIWTDQFGRRYGWTVFYRTIIATIQHHEDFDIISHWESHGTQAINNVNIRFVIMDAGGYEVANYTRQANMPALQTGELTTTFKATRAGFYIVMTNITVANDPVTTDDQLSTMVRVAKFLDNMENGTTQWDSTGGWALQDDEAEAFSPTHYWRFSKNGQVTAAGGEFLTSPWIDLRFYNVSYQHPNPNLPGDSGHVLFLQYLWKGRMEAAGDTIDMQIRSKNDTTWRSLVQYTNDQDDDYSDGWYVSIYGFDLGNYAGAEVQFRWKVVKTNRVSRSWWGFDDVCLFMHEELNDPPWFIYKTPDSATVDHDVGKRLELNATTWDPTDDEPITFQWYEDGIPLAGETTDRYGVDIPLTAPVGDKYRRGNSLDIMLRVYDDRDYNETVWTVNLLDPRPEKVKPENQLEINEDEETDIDFGTAQNVIWFKDVEDQDFTVTATSTSLITVTAKANNVLTLVNAIPDWNGYANVTVKVTDSAGSFNEYVFEVQVLPVNDAPKWKEVTLPPAEEDSYYSFNLTATDKDNEYEQLTYSDDSPHFDITAGAEIAFTPTNDHVGDNYFNVTVKDPDGAEDVMSLVLLVVNVNDPPTIKPIPKQTINEDELFSLNVSSYVEDPDLNLPPEYRDIMTYRDDSTKIDTNVETGEVTWTPENADVGTHFFTITVTDSKARSAQREVEIQVLNANDPPKLGIIGQQNLVQGRPYEYTVPASDDDLSAPGVVEQLTFTNDHTELFTINPDTGRISFSPDNEDVGRWEVVIRVTDSEGDFDERTVIFIIDNVNDAPRIEYIPAQTLTEDVPFELQIDASDPDMDARKLDGEPVDPSERLNYRTNNSRVLIDSTGLLTFTPTNADSKAHSLTVRITVVDASSETATVDVTFAITAVNDPPQDLAIIGLVSGQKVKTGQKITLMGQAVDIDDTPDRLVYRWYAGTTLIGQTQNIVWKPKKGGMTPVRLVVSDPDQAEAEANVTVQVQEVADGGIFEGSMMWIILIVVIVVVVAVVVMFMMRRGKGEELEP